MILHQFKKLSIRNLGPPTTGKHITFQLPKKETPPLRPRVDSTVPRPTRFTEGGQAVIGQVGHWVCWPLAKESGKMNSGCVRHTAG